MSPVRRPLIWLATVAASAALCLLLPSIAPPVAVSENLADDLRFTLATASEPQSEQIVLITIDEDTLVDMAYRAPVDRRFLANLIADLDSKGVRAIGLDLFIDHATEPDKDRELLDVLRSIDLPLVAITSIEPHPMTERQRRYLETVLADDVPYGYANLTKDPFDSVVRWNYPVGTGPSGPENSFVSQLAIEIGRIPPTAPLRIAWRSRDENGADAFAAYPAHLVENLPDEWVDGRIALIGADLPDEDRHRTPLSLTQDLMSGVEIHAHMLSQILDNTAIRTPGPLGTLFIVALLAVLGVFLAEQPWQVTAKASATTGAVVILCVAGGLLFRFADLLIPLVTPSMAFVMAFGITSAAAQRRFRIERRFIRSALEHYVAPGVVRRLEANPARLRLEGERRDVTVLATDITGFTTLSEGRQPEMLTDLLNDYFDRLTTVVMDHGGTIERLNGDGLIAIFGAPEEQDDQAVRAVACACEIQRQIDPPAPPSREAHATLGSTRVGIHSGPAVVGNIGGRNRFNYMVIGDTPNTASRLEGANKFLGTLICVSGETVLLCPRQTFRPVGRLQLIGKHQPIDAFEPWPAQGKDPRFLSEYERVYRLIEVKAPAALGEVERLAKQYPDDPILRLFKTRLSAGDLGTVIRLLEK